MSDLISRQAAIDAIDKIFPADPMRNDYTQGITCGAALAEEYIKQLPSAQPQRKSGKWIKHIDNLFPAESTLECNVCHHEQPITIDDNFCPNCGTRMEGK